MTRRKVIQYQTFSNLKFLHGIFLDLPNMCFKTYLNYFKGQQYYCHAIGQRIETMTQWASK